MSSNKKPHFHILKIDGRVAAMVATWDKKDHNIIMPWYFLYKGDYLETIGAWMTPFVTELFDNQKPLFLRDHNGHEFEVDKDASVSTFFL